MRIGVPKELKAEEYRAALTPAAVAELVGGGHRVMVERGVGAGARFDDAEYERAGASLGSRDEVWTRAEIVVKVKEPIEDELPYLRDDLVLFTYLHLAANERLTRALVESGTTAIAYETVQTDDGRLPLLAPMSAIAGRISVQAAARFLEAPAGGRGQLLGPIPGVAPGHIVVVGGGNVGYHAASVALGLGARVTLFDLSIERLAHLETVMQGPITLRVAEGAEVEETVADADAVIGAVLVPGAEAPKVLRRAAIAAMPPGSVLCDVAIDQGGCAETSKPTTHAEPTFLVGEVVHYCVANMPGAVPRTATRGLSANVLPYLKDLADQGPEQAIATDGPIARGVNVLDRRVTNAGVAAAHGFTVEPPGRPARPDAEAGATPLAD